MIVSQGKVTVKAGHEEKVKQLWQQVIEHVNNDQPNYALYAFSNDDFRSFTGIHIAANSEAMQNYISSYARYPELGQGFR